MLREVSSRNHRAVSVVDTNLREGGAHYETRSAHIPKTISIKDIVRKQFSQFVLPSNILPWKIRTGTNLRERPPMEKGLPMN